VKIIRKRKNVQMYTFIIILASLHLSFSDKSTGDEWENKTEESATGQSTNEQCSPPPVLTVKVEIEDEAGERSDGSEHGGVLYLPLASSQRYADRPENENGVYCGLQEDACSSTSGLSCSGSVASDCDDNIESFRDTQLTANVADGYEIKKWEVSMTGSSETYCDEPESTCTIAKHAEAPDKSHRNTQVTLVLEESSDEGGGGSCQTGNCPTPYYTF
jgi:hypothetical protein